MWRKQGRWELTYSEHLLIPGTVRAIYANCLLLSSKDKTSQGIGIILILQMNNLGLREVQKPIQDSTARSQQSQVGDPLLSLPGMCALSLARWSSLGLRLPLCGWREPRDNGVSYPCPPPLLGVRSELTEKGQKQRERVTGGEREHSEVGRKAVWRGTSGTWSGGSKCACWAGRLQCQPHLVFAAATGGLIWFLLEGAI